MKKLSHFILMSVIGLLLFSSCSRLGDISVSKRHYRSGYTVDLGFSKKAEPKIKADGISLPQNPYLASVQKKASRVTVSGNNTSQPEIRHTASPQRNITAPDAAPHHTYASLKAMTEPNRISVSEFISASPAVSLSSDKRSSESTPLWVLVVLAILLPPLAVGLKYGIIDKFWISVLLTLLFWIPGVIYALIVVT